MRESSSYLPDYAPSSPREVLSLPLDFPTDNTATDLRAYWHILVGRWQLIATVALSTVLATALIVLLMKPIYTAETTLLIERNAPQALNLSGATAEAQGPDEYDYYRTQYEILKSRGLITQVIQEQQLDKNPLFEGQEQSKGLIGQWFTRIGARLERLIAPTRTSVPQEGGSSTNEFRTDDEMDSSVSSGTANGEPTNVPPEIIEQYGLMLDVRPVPRTRLVKIAFSTPEPVLSARLANAHAQAYIRQGVERRSRTDEEAQGFLEEKLVELRTRLEKSEAALNNYRRDHGIISFDEKENVAVERLGDLNKSLTEAETQRIGLEVQLSRIRQKTYDLLPSVIESSLIQNLKEELMRVEAERSQLLSQFKADYPQVQEIEAKIVDIRNRLRQEVQRIADGITVAYQFAVSREEELRKKLEQQTALVLQLKDASVKYAILDREVDTNRQLYDNILQRMKEVGVVAESRDSNISVIDEAEAPVRPSKPKRALSLLLSAIVGLMGGVGLTFFLEYLDNTIPTPEEAERVLRLPNLAVVPDFARAQALEGDALHLLPNGHDTRTLNGDLNGASGSVRTPGGLIIDHHAFSPFTESYRTLRMSILLSCADETPKVILFTSATEGEGKTSTAINTAITFAQLGMRTLLIDGDLRRPRCHKALGVHGGVGLTEYLTGQRDVRQVIKPTMVSGLFFLSSGALPPNPTELIASHKMRDTLHLLRQEYDSIIIDSPPVMPVSDPLLLSTIVDGVVLVVNGQKTPREVVREARSRLSQVRAKTLGSVLNRVDLQHKRYGYHYGYHAAPTEQEDAAWQELEDEMEIGE